MANLYKKIAKADQLNQDGGYKNIVLWAPRDTFTSIKMPVVGGTPAAGDSLKITTAHTFGASDGFISWLCKQGSVTITGQTNGDPGSKIMTYSTKFVLLGDSASTQEQLESLLNDDVIALFKDANCLAATDYVQLGNDCINPEFDVKFDGKTTNEGLKEYEVTMTCKKAKYFYSATVTEKP